MVLTISTINYSWGCDFFTDPNPITRELLKDSQVQLVYYNFNSHDSLAITRDKDNATLLLYLLEGEMTLHSADSETLLRPNDSVLLGDLHESLTLTARTPAKCLGISTNPSQHVAGSNELMSMIDVVEEKDIYTYGHSRRVCLYSNTIALELDRGYNIIPLGSAADLHDVGKINVPLDILQKPGKLTKEEYDIIKQHSMDSYHILQPLGEDVALAARQHHERLDGSGYPDALKGDDICLNAKIIAIADVFDAITCKRIYNDPMSFEDAVAYLESCTEQYDQTLVALLKKKVQDGTLHRKAIHSSFQGEE